MPTATPTPTSFVDLCKADPDCIYGYEDLISPIAWQPSLSNNGAFSTEIETTSPLAIDWIWPGIIGTDEYVTNISFYKDNTLIAVLQPPPPANADWEWTDEPGYYTADVFEVSSNGNIIVRGTIAPGILDVADEVCVWNGEDLINCTTL